MKLEEYRSYRGLPPVAGLCSFAEAARPGLSVEQCVSRLKRYHYSLKRLHQIFLARLAAEPIYELKMGFSLHAYLCAEHVAALRRRIGEMREPPLGLDAVPDPALALFFDELRAAGSTAELIVGVYEVAIPALIRGLERHTRDANPLVDQPSLRVARFALLELRELAEYGARSAGCLVDAASRAAMAPWRGTLEQALAAAGDLDGVQPRRGGVAAPMRSAQPYCYDPRPRRDERFPDPYNMGVHAEVFLYDESRRPEDKSLMMYYKRLREIDVPEMMSSIITETADKPWGYYLDMTRQLWDEARHAMMGEVGFVQAGVNWPEHVRVNFTWSLALNTQLTAAERHSVLYFIEQGLMPRNGKRYEWEVGQKSGSAYAAMIQDYDWADEVLHARVGRDWYVSQFKSPQEAVETGDRNWSKALIDWGRYRADGLTQHFNWWPGLYRAACEARGVEPDPSVSNYAVTYEEKRADLKSVEVSG
ncbi:MAG: hypothetical protein HY299_08000 [Verrucomicrobia bacterium]|nr:hypothetical protein [Verrucomicrobiota bacterium]